jgi:hypothetical protein
MTSSTPKWKTLKEAADWARQRAAHEQAIELYSQALSKPNLSWKQHCAMILSRADCTANGSIRR